jgi:hypothetical protein
MIVLMILRGGPSSREQEQEQEQEQEKEREQEQEIAARGRLTPCAGILAYAR